MKKTIVITAGSIILLALLIGAVAYFTVPSFHNEVGRFFNSFASTAAPAKEAPAEEKAVATEAPAIAPAATETPAVEKIETPAPEVKAEVVNFAPPANALALKSEDTIVGYFYVLNKEGPAEVTYPKQATVLVTAGNATVKLGDYEQKMTTDKKGTVGNIFTDVCTEGSCKLTVSEYKAGNVGITIIFGGAEDPKETLAGTVNNMFKAPNCGGSGCITINVYNAKNDPKSESFVKAVTGADLVKILTAPAEPFVTVEIKFADVPADAKALLRNDKVVGHEYYLADKDVFVSVPEGGITVFVCGTDCTIDGTTYKAGSAVSLSGTPSDGKTPADLNFTVSVKSNDPTMVRVYMFYNGNPADELAALQALYPDKNWINK